MRGSVARNDIFSLKRRHYVPKRGYLGLLSNNRIFIYYPIISYRRIEVYKVETMYMGRLHYNNGVSVKSNPSKYHGTCSKVLDTLVGLILCFMMTHF